MSGRYGADDIFVFGLGGVPLRTVGGAGSGPGEFKAPGGGAVAANGDLYVADFYNQRVQRLRPDDTFFRQWGTTGKVRIGAGNVFAADFYNHRVQKFRPDGAFLTAFGDKGEGPERLTYAMGVAVAADGSVFVTDFGNHRITKWRPGKTGG